MKPSNIVLSHRNVSRYPRLYKHTMARKAKHRNRQVRHPIRYDSMYVSQELQAHYTGIGSIQKLPNELLVHIFELYGEAMYPQDPERETHAQWCEHPADESGSHYVWGHRTLWIPLMLVCRFWRELALATPSLWRTVDVYKNLLWLELALSRSRNAPLELFFQDLRTARDAVPMILPHAPRLRKVILPPLNLDRANHKQIRPDFGPFLPLFGTVLTTLSHLLLSVDDRSYTAQLNYTRLDLSDGCFPSLRSLHVAIVYVPWHSTLLSKLTSLDLRRCAPTDTMQSCDQFLDALKSCHTLQILRLLNMFVSAVLAPDAIDAAMQNGARTLHLPQLRTLVLEDHATVTTWLLTCLRFKGNVSVSIIGHLPAGLDIERTPGQFQSIVPCSGLVNHFFPVEAPQYGEIHIWADSAKLRVWSDTGSELCLELQSAAQRETWEPYFLEGMREFRLLFGGLPLIDLSIHGHFDDVLSAEWVGFLEKFPKLQYLEVLGSTSVIPLFRALKHASIPGKLKEDSDTSDEEESDGETDSDQGDSQTDSSDEASQDDGLDNDNGVQRPPCPKLSTLELEYPRFEPGDIELLVAVLYRRAYFKLAPMQRVELFFNSDHRWDDFREELHAFYGELKQLCPDVSYPRCA